MNIETAFATDGPLAKAIPGFSPRPQQIEMAAHIAATLKKTACWWPRPAPAPARPTPTWCRRC
jgi:hypothetical protein